MLQGTKRKYTDENQQERICKRKLQSIESHALRLKKARDGKSEKPRRVLVDVNGDTTLVNPDLSDIATPVKRTSLGGAKRVSLSREYVTPQRQKIVLEPKPIVKKPVFPVKKDFIDPLVEYAEEILSHELHLESITRPRNWLDIQPRITSEHRCILLNWLFNVHASLNLLPETLHLSINLTDRFLSIRPISLEKYQLTAITSLWIACKTIETVSPSITDLNYVCDDGYTLQELRKAELFILGTLNWTIGVDGWSGLYNWLARLNKLDGNDWHVGTLSRFLSEAFVVACPGAIQVSGRFLACGSVWLARKMWALSLGIPWDGITWEDHGKAGGYEGEEVEVLAKAIFDVVRQGKGFDQVKEFYGRDEYCGVSKWVEEWMGHYL